jgi:hypothetical protein
MATYELIRNFIKIILFILLMVLLFVVFKKKSKLF